MNPTQPQRRYSVFDRFISQADNALRTVAGGHAGTDRPNPTAGTDVPALDRGERRHVAGLMRVNHTGEVCAPASGSKPRCFRDVLWFCSWSSGHRWRVMKFSPAPHQNRHYGTHRHLLR